VNLLLLASFQAALIALAVLALERFAGRWLTPRLRFALWSLVALRLVLVVPLSDPFQTTRPQWWTWQQQADATASAPAQAPIDLQRAVPVTIRTAQDRATEGLAHEKSHPPTVGTRAGLELPIGPQIAGQSEAFFPDEMNAGAASTETLPEAESAWWKAVLWSVWLIGIAVSLLSHVVSERKLRRHLRRSGIGATTELQDLVDRCAIQLGVRGPVRAVMVDALPSPAAYGWRHSQILLPQDIEQQLDEQELRFVLLHELAHLRHRDAWQNLGLALLQTAHWFNPVVRLAFQRLRDERELLRDEEALRALPHVPAKRCAATLVKLLPRQAAPHAQASLSALVPHRQTTKRRISMIIHPWQPKRLQLIPGLACLAVVAWAGLTHSFASAETPQTQAGTNSAFNTDEPRSIRVVRQTSKPEWHADVRTKLQSKVSWQATINYEDLFAYLKQVSGLEFRATDYVFEDAPDIPAFPIETTLENALNLFCESSHARWDIEPGGVYFASIDEEPLTTDLRFYDIAPLVEGNQELAWDLAERVMELSNRHSDWDWNDTSMRVWNGQLLVSQSDPMHTRVEKILNMLLRRESEKAPAMPDAHRALFQGRITIDSPSITEHILPLLTAQGIPFVMYGDMLDSRLEDRPFDNVPFSAVLEEFAWENGIEMYYQGGVLYWIETPPMRTVVYDISDLVKADASEVARWMSDEDVSERDARYDIRGSNTEDLVDLVMELSGNNAWESDASSILEWDGLLLITNRDTVHHAVDSLLETARRAVRR